MREIGPIQRRGLRRLGQFYFPDFPRVASVCRAMQLADSLEPTEQRQLAFLLAVAAFVPQWLVRVLFLCEDENRTGTLWRLLAPVHFEIKGLCALIYFAARDDAEKEGNG